MKKSLFRLQAAKAETAVICTADYTCSLSKALPAKISPRDFISLPGIQIYKTCPERKMGGRH